MAAAAPQRGARTSTILDVGASVTARAVHSRKVLPTTESPKRSITRYPAAAAQKAPTRMRDESSERVKTVRNERTPPQAKTPYISSMPGTPTPAASCNG